MPEGAQPVLHHLKLDLVSCCNFSWRVAHNKMLMRHLIALDNLKKTLPLIDEDQKLALLHSELAKLQKASTNQVSAFTVFPMPTVPLSPIPVDRMSDEGRVIAVQTGEGVILDRMVAGAEDRAGTSSYPAGTQPTATSTIT